MGSRKAKHVPGPKWRSKFQCANLPLKTSRDGSSGLNVTREGAVTFPTLRGRSQWRLRTVGSETKGMRSPSLQAAVQADSTARKESQRLGPLLPPRRSNEAMRHHSREKSKTDCSATLLVARTRNTNGSLGGSPRPVLVLVVQNEDKAESELQDDGLESNLRRRATASLMFA